MNRIILLGLLLLSFLVNAEEKKETAENLSVEECIKYAYLHSPELKTLELRMSNSKYNTIIARAAFDLSLTMKNTRNVETLVDSHKLTLNQKIPGGFSFSASGDTALNDISNTQSADLSVTISKVILGGGTIEESMEGVRDGLVDELISLNNIHREKRKIRFHIQRHFYRVIRNLQSLEIQKSKLARSKRNLEIAEVNEKPLDITTAKIDIPDTELSILSVEKNIATELDSLKVTMGMLTDQSIAIVEDFTYQVEKFAIKEDLLFAERNEEKFVNHALNKEKLQRDLRISKSKDNIDLSLNLTHNIASDGTETANLNGVDEQVISLNFNWVPGERIKKANVAKANNNLDENSVGLYILRQNKMRSLRNLHRALHEAERSVTIQKLRIQLNERQLELYKDRWDEGDIDILEYIRSQNALERSKVDLINFKTNYMQLVAEYLFEVGK